MRLSLRKPESELHPEASQDLKFKVKAKVDKNDANTTELTFFLKVGEEFYRKSLR